MILNDSSITQGQPSPYSYPGINVIPRNPISIRGKINQSDRAEFLIFSVILVFLTFILFRITLGFF